MMEQSQNISTQHLAPGNHPSDDLRDDHSDESRVILPNPYQTSTLYPTTLGSGDDQVVANTSYGLVGVIVFGIVIVLIIIIGRRRSSRDDDEEQWDDLNSGFSGDEDEEAVAVKLQMRLFGTGGRESYYDITKYIRDDELLESVDAVTICVSCLTLSRQLGRDPPNEIADGVSFGVSGFILFLVVLGVVFYLRRRCTAHCNGDIDSASDSSLSDSADSSVNDKRESVQRAEFQRLCSVNGSDTWSHHGNIMDMVHGVVLDCTMLSMGRIVGRGQFGAVYEAKLQKQDGGQFGQPEYQRVAVKTLRGAAMSEDEVEGFLREGVIMRDFEHPHVLGLVGVAFGDHGVPMIILPFMANGSLKGYITQQDLNLSIRRLLEFGHQVAQGMEYLANQKFVHRDLATRNCMLDDELMVKVADFGLSRDIYTREYYTSHDREAKLPVKWMAVESLTSGVYTTKSDVWSFGVLLWELMTRGVTPYPDVANWDIRAYVSSGRRMSCPQMCPEDIYEMMLRCWRDEAADRPSFTELCDELHCVLHEDEGHGHRRDYYINVEPLTP